MQRIPPTCVQAKTRLHTHHSNVDAVVNYYKDIMVNVSVRLCVCTHHVEDHQSPSPLCPSPLPPKIPTRL